MGTPWLRDRSSEKPTVPGTGSEAVGTAGAVGGAACPGEAVLKGTGLYGHRICGRLIGGGSEK